MFEEDKVLTEFLGADGFGGFAEVVGQLADTSPVGLAGALTDADEFQVIGEGF
jgi:hypothetical protein